MGQTDNAETDSSPNTIPQTNQSRTKYNANVSITDLVPDTRERDTNMTLRNAGHHKHEQLPISEVSST